MKTKRWVSSGMVMLLGVAFGTANAGPEAGGTSSMEVLFQPPRMPDLTTEKGKDEVPMLEATVIGAPNQPMEKFVLIDKSSKTPVEIKATAKRDFKQGNETLAVAIVMEGWEQWIGNDKEVPDLPTNETPMPGVLIELRTALDRLNFKDAGPAGSKGMIITYGDKPVIRVPMGPLSDLSGSKLGTQKDYYQTTGVELVSAIRLALAELKKVQAARKVLIVVCDSNDTNNDAARGQLTNMKREAQQEQIQTFAIVYRAKLSGEANVIPIMIKETSTVTTAENIASSIQSILARMADRQYLTFPGYNRKTNTGLLWDNKSHDLVIKVDKEESDPVSVQLQSWQPTEPAGFPWIILVIVIVALLLLIIIGVKIFSKKEVPLPAPMPMPAPIAAPMEPPKPMGPMKTVMIGQGGDEGGFPVVGWLVPLNGPNAYQTMRLRSSGTKIGTAPPADIVINDGFMSTEHCQINCSPQGYTLIDGGSTNGSYVNDRKIAGKHELVDNDLITLGKTNFKFKSIV